MYIFVVKHFLLAILDDYYDKYNISQFEIILFITE